MIMNATNRSNHRSASKTISWSSSVRSLRSPLEKSTPAGVAVEEDDETHSLEDMLLSPSKKNNTANNNDTATFHESLGSIDAGDLFISPLQQQQYDAVMKSKQHQNQQVASSQPTTVKAAAQRHHSMMANPSFDPEAFGDMNASLELDFHNSGLVSYVAFMAEDAERTAKERIARRASENDENDNDTEKADMILYNVKEDKSNDAANPSKNDDAKDSTAVAADSQKAKKKVVINSTNATAKLLHILPEETPASQNNSNTNDNSFSILEDSISTLGFDLHSSSSNTKIGMDSMTTLSVFNSSSEFNISKAKGANITPWMQDSMSAIGVSCMKGILADLNHKEESSSGGDNYNSIEKQENLTTKEALAVQKEERVLKSKNKPSILSSAKNKEVLPKDKVEEGSDKGLSSTNHQAIQSKNKQKDHDAEEVLGEEEALRQEKKNSSSRSRKKGGANNMALDNTLLRNKSKSLSSSEVSKAEISSETLDEDNKGPTRRPKSFQSSSSATTTKEAASRSSLSKKNKDIDGEVLLKTSLSKSKSLSSSEDIGRAASLSKVLDSALLNSSWKDSGDVSLKKKKENKGKKDTSKKSSSRRRATVDEGRLTRVGEEKLTAKSLKQMRSSVTDGMSLYDQRKSSFLSSDTLSKERGSSKKDYKSIFEQYLLDDENPSSSLAPTRSNSDTLSKNGVKARPSCKKSSRSRRRATVDEGGSLRDSKEKLTAKDLKQMRSSVTNGVASLNDQRKSSFLSSETLSKERGSSKKGAKYSMSEQYTLDDENPSSLALTRSSSDTLSKNGVKARPIGSKSLNRGTRSSITKETPCLSDSMRRSLSREKSRVLSASKGLHQMRRSVTNNTDLQERKGSNLTEETSLMISDSDDGSCDDRVESLRKSISGLKLDLQESCKDVLTKSENGEKKGTSPDTQEYYAMRMSSILYGDGEDFSC